MEIQEVKESEISLPPSFLVVAVAVNGSKSSKYAVRWALEKFVPEGRNFFRLLHVRPPIKMVPTPMGNYIPISDVREDVAAAYKKEIEWQTNSMLLLYKQMCAQRRVEAESVVIEADNVAEAISGEIAKFSISKLVIGSSSRNVFTRKIGSNKMSSRISSCIPGFCTVYVVLKGKLLSVRASTTVVDDMTNEENISSTSRSFSSLSSSARSEWTDTDITSSSLHHASLPIQRNQALANINSNFVNMGASPSDTLHTRSISLFTDDDFISSSSIVTETQCDNSMVSSYRSFQTDNQLHSPDQASTSEVRTDSSVPGNQVDVSFELEKLRVELRHFQKLCVVARSESNDASQQLHELTARRMEEEIKLKEIELREQMVRELARQEREKRETAERESKFIKECAEREVLHRKDSENNAAREANEKQRLEKALACNDEPYKKYTWEEIESATSSFSDCLTIGRGANGIVYKGSFHHTTAAVKVLHSNEGHGTMQFKQELEILSKIHHPHLLLLLGACTERGCLVYEYMENGSLDDRLQCKDNTAPLPWFHRYRIAWEVASALAFLHNSKPEPIIHRDLKPANILLDRNFVSKIGDVGLSTLLPAVNLPMCTMIKDTTPVGTMFYIDPEYQRTGLVSAKSDIYALGMVILQLLTAKPPMGLTLIVERALEEGNLMEVLDPGAGQWPLEETQELALLGLGCAELRRKDRPALKEQVLPLLEKLKVIADKAHVCASHTPSAPPNHFICPILQEVMNDPCVASDGYTYDRKAIEIWLGMNDKSPMTNLQLPNKNLIPNHSLRSAIMDWKSRSQ
ncbi:U-box domain-containing protein 52-like isoform X1 [Phoenix dactylifera]|uniref:RING-type E3 ubiquitin transferase n=1 Tax=Phoenix dactylifera TaxID=42345 RepID=A0A8B7CZ06_PHODC|nr:U-box domain-containing protein 52-like isoform X1 [Phoenix dactylifera]XP_008809458.2 U-box domain-containing protein 52-like isoform X1 [Phoenix dactylifera]XP_008809459.2 U-box domain-containing protein 52-like isoform X1 [Phoenix dactylifera]XP_017701681.2 U-box domain-containing protein 52-like isoform X1 [Phoenix dactylifera]XP_026665845.2 U-box domain-containing protein 52-like isoform X1 [Phoenix dactylifera]